jgi:hypothetical protein
MPDRWLVYDPASQNVCQLTRNALYQAPMVLASATIFPTYNLYTINLQWFLIIYNDFLQRVWVEFHLASFDHVICDYECRWTRVVAALATAPPTHSNGKCNFFFLSVFIWFLRCYVMSQWRKPTNCQSYDHQPPTVRQNDTTSQRTAQPVDERHVELTVDM